MAHVRTIREVVGTVGANKGLVEERRFIAGASGGVEDRPVGRGCCVKRIRNHGKGILPRDWSVVRFAFPQHHGRRQAPLHVEFVITHFRQFLHAVLSEELRRDVRLHGFVGHGFRTVFTKFERRAVLRVGPGAPRTVKPLGLIDHAQGLHGFQGTHLFQSMKG